MKSLPSMIVVTVGMKCRAVRLGIETIHDDSQDVPTGLYHAVSGGLCVFVRDGSGVQGENHAVDQGRQQERVVHREDRRRIYQNQIVCPSTEIENRLHRRRTETVE